MSETKPVKKNKPVLIVFVILLLLTAVVGWWLFPVRPLRGREPQEITRIDVDGFPGAGTVTLNAEETRLIAENLYECNAVRTGISFGRMGYVFQLHIFEGDKHIRSFSVNSGDHARDSLFFYKPANGSYCIDYLNDLLKKYSSADK